MRGLILAAPRSGSGKTLLTLGLIGALRRTGLVVAPAKTGPDYIDTAILARVAGREAINLDPFAMATARLRTLAAEQGRDADLLLIEGVMGLFDGAASGQGSTGDLAANLGLPVIFVLDAEKQGQSVAPLAAGFLNWRADVRIAGLILNRIGSSRHEAMLRTSLAPLGLPVLGAIPKHPGLVLPDRHLGLVLPDEIERFDAIIHKAADLVSARLDLPALLGLAYPLRALEPGPRLAPLGQRIAIARDDAFSFLYTHWLRDWRRQGAELHFFSPLSDEAIPADAQAVFLPGGYPELHAQKLAAAQNFKGSLVAARDRGALIYGECGGFMVLGQTLTDKLGATHPMAGLLPISTRIDKPRRTLGYRRLRHQSPLPWPETLVGHEFHYSSGEGGGEPLFFAHDALGDPVTLLGTRQGRVMGSYAHVIDMA
jgi:cobyrinic acid a,c-diamide synthase